MIPEPDYWAAAATVGPVLAATLVIEGKTIREYFDPAEHPLLTSIINTQYALTLFALGVTEMICFYALRTSNFGPLWAIITVEGSISTCIGVLTISPAMIFFATGTTTAWFGIRMKQLKMKIFLKEHQRDRLRSRLTELRLRRRNALKQFQASADWNAKIAEKIEEYIVDKAEDLDYLRLNELFKLHEQTQKRLVALHDIIEDTESEIASEAEETATPDEPLKPAEDNTSSSLDFRRFDPHFRD